MEYNYEVSTSAGTMDPAVADAMGAGAVTFMGVFMLAILLVALASYVYMAVCLMKIAKKTNTENGWLAWIPVANVVLMLQIAKKPVW